MSTNENELNQKTIDIKSLFYEFMNRWYLTLSILVVCVVLSLVYSLIIATPLYDSTAKIYIMNKNSPDISTADLSISSYLTKDYEELIVDRAVLEEVSKELDNKYSFRYLKSAVSVANPENTRFIEITVRSSKATNSKEIVDKICEISQKKIVELMGIDHVTIIRNGNLPSAPSTPNVKLNVIKGILLGLIFSVGIVLVMYLQNDKINGPDDVKKYLDISVLGVIPYNSNRAKAK